MFNQLENKEQNFEDLLQVAIDSSFKGDITGRETSANGSVSPIILQKGKKLEEEAYDLKRSTFFNLPDPPLWRIVSGKEIEKCIFVL